LTLSAIVACVDEIVPADRIERTISVQNTSRLLIALTTRGIIIILSERR
jgi:hypothetical protein